MGECMYRAWDGERMHHFGLRDISANGAITGSEHGCIDLYNGERKGNLMKYTGLKDRNGEIDIYEGDIVRLSRYLGTPGRFEVVTGAVSWHAPVFEVDIDGEVFSRCELHGGAEVIGNIYENPELLGQSQ